MLSQALALKANGRIDSLLYKEINEVALEQYKPPHLEAILNEKMDEATARLLVDWVLAHQTNIFDPILKVNPGFVPHHWCNVAQACNTACHLGFADSHSINLRRQYSSRAASEGTLLHPLLPLQTHTSMHGVLHTYMSLLKAAISLKQLQSWSYVLVNDQRCHLGKLQEHWLVSASDWHSLLQAKSQLSHVLEVAAAKANVHILRLLLGFQEMPVVIAAVKRMNILPMVGRIEADVLRQTLRLGAGCNRRDPFTGPQLYTR